MNRQNFFLGPVTERILREHARTTGMSMSEIVRRAIEQYVAPARKPDDEVKG